MYSCYICSSLSFVKIRLLGKQNLIQVLLMRDYALKMFWERRRKTSEERQIIKGILPSSCHHREHELNTLKISEPGKNTSFREITVKEQESQANSYQAWIQNLLFGAYSFHAHYHANRHRRLQESKTKTKTKQNKTKQKTFGKRHRDAGSASVARMHCNARAQQGKGRHRKCLLQLYSSESFQILLYFFFTLFIFAFYPL